MIKKYSIIMMCCSNFFIPPQSNAVHLIIANDIEFQERGNLREKKNPLVRRPLFIYTKGNKKKDDPQQYECARKQKDERKRVWETTQWPYCFQGRVKTELGKGTGVLVGPRHVLTAAHVVWNDGVASEIKFTPAYKSESKGKAPFGVAKAVRIHTFEEWDDNKDKRYDLALIILDKPIGEEAGWAGMKVYKNIAFLKEREIRVTGYPADKPGMQTMMGHPKTVEEDLLRYEIDTYKGSCGRTPKNVTSELRSLPKIFF